ncbi:haloalkane dehalogenase [Mycobacterium malmoense]|uniref:haloalkane dehalogenase n=1 Tax=Mycobacterium malmoense TaxID=1780 RepID=UPI0008F94AE7|nr:haloalkane dehalogenase [Mycobacterium malmoense]OIN79458.1 haloalkane dehalogenase [Mycobacterium malmoense]
MDVLRTPDSRFENLEGYPFVANYLDVAAGDTPPLRMHFLDEGPADGPPIVLLHGEPTWSYLYRTMIPPLADAGNRVLAPDLIGFGRSDKPSRIEDYTYLRHVEWVTSWFERLNLKDVTLFAQDWGSLIGLRIAAERGDRIARLVVANGFLPTAERPTSPAFFAWRAFARYSPVLPAGRIVSAGTVRRVSPKVRAGYDAPFPDKAYQAGARAFPNLVPTAPNDPAIPANRAAWDGLGRWEKPFLAIFGARDPILGRADRPLIKHIPGAAGQPHARINASHFIQEDAGPELADRLLSWQQALR